MNEELVDQYISLRALVGFLGEKTQYNWWDTNFLNRTGLQFLSINFPRTSFVAGVTSVTEAARRLHDSRIGKGGVFHLFRFPISIEETIHRRLLEIDGGSVINVLVDREAAMEELKSMSDSTVDAPEGPVQIGIEKHILQNSSIDELAKHYFDAFSTGKQVLPYFSVI